jgi:dTDP-4-dehydrorhamnose reductase
MNCTKVNPTILIVGASGMVGYAFCREALSLGWNVVAVGRKDRHLLRGVRFESVDLVDDGHLRKVFTMAKPDFVVNLAANTDHRNCEDYPEEARDLHVAGAAKVAALARSGNARHVHLSSEAVYGDLGVGPRVETETCRPNGVYATTKKDGEIAVMEAYPDAIVLRCTPVGLVPGERRSLAGWLMGEFRDGRAITGFGDWVFSPVETAGLARMLLENWGRLPTGIRNWGAAVPMSKLMFAEKLAMELGFPSDMVLSGSRFKDGSRFDVSLDSSSLATGLGIRPPAPEEIFRGLAKAAAYIIK